LHDVLAAAAIGEPKTVLGFGSALVFFRRTHLVITVD